MRSRTHRRKAGGGERRPGRRERRRAETRERLLHAALEQFARKGFMATKVEDITEAADVGKGTFFNYFPSKEHVLAAFGEMQLGKFRAELEALREGRKPTREALLHAVGAVAEVPGRSPELVRSLLTANLTSKPVRGVMGERMEQARGMLTELFRLGQERGEVGRQAPAEDFALAFMQIFFGGLFLWTMNPEMPLAERQVRAVEAFWSGMGSKAETSKEQRS